MSRDRARKAADAPASRAREVTVWTDDRVAAVCARHARGEFLKHACAMEGGTYDGLIDAMARDPAIRLAVAVAHAKGVDLLRARMNEAGAEVDDEGRRVRYGDWKREAWLLERFDRQAFAPPKQELDAKVKTELSDETAAAVLAVARAAAKEGE